MIRLSCSCERCRCYRFFYSLSPLSILNISAGYYFIILSLQKLFFCSVVVGGVAVGAVADGALAIVGVAVRDVAVGGVAVGGVAVGGVAIILGIGGESCQGRSSWDWNCHSLL